MLAQAAEDSEHGRRMDSVRKELHVADCGHPAGQQRQGTNRELYT